MIFLAKLFSHGSIRALRDEIFMAVKIFFLGLPIWPITMDTAAFHFVSRYTFQYFLTTWRLQKGWTMLTMGCKLERGAPLPVETVYTGII